MGVLSRIYSILRASISTGKERDLFDDQDFQDLFSNGRRRRTSQAQRDDFDRQPPKQDPELSRYYANLEVPYGSDLETVRKAWKTMLRKYHPDLHSAEPEKARVANELVQGLNHAYEQLEKRLKQA